MGASSTKRKSAQKRSRPKSSPRQSGPKDIADRPEWVPVVTAWRGWALWGDGRLRGPAMKVRSPVAGAVLGTTAVLRASGLPPPLTVWENGESEASCRNGCPVSPEPSCSCGVYGVTDVEALVGYSGSTGNPWKDHAHVIGQVELSGRIVQGGNPYDPPSTVRGQHGRVGPDLYFARPVWGDIRGVIRRHPWVTAHRVESLRDIPALLGVEVSEPEPEPASCECLRRCHACLTADAIVAEAAAELAEAQ